MDKKELRAENMSLFRIANFQKRWGVTRGLNFYDLLILSFLSVVLILNPLLQLWGDGNNFVSYGGGTV